MKKKIICLILLSILIIAILSGFISYGNKYINSSMGHYTIDTNKTFYINGNESNFYTLEWDKDYVEVYSTNLFNIIYKNKPYTINYNNNKLELDKTPNSKIIFSSISSWPFLDQIANYKTNANECILNKIDFIVCYPENTEIEFTGNKVELKSTKFEFN